MLLYNQIRQSQSTSGISIAELYQLVTSAELSALINSIRSEQDQAKQASLKRDLPAYMPSMVGRDGRKRKEDAIGHTGILFFDIDKLQVREVEKYKNLAKQCPLITLAYTSSRGNGLHMLVQVSGLDAYTLGAAEINHLDAYDKVSKELAKYGFPAFDLAAKSFNRLAFISHDPDAVYDPEASVYEFAPIGASSAANVESKIATSSPDTLAIVSIKGDKRYERFHSIIDLPTTPIYKPYGEIVKQGILDLDQALIAPAYFEGKDVGVYFSKALEYPLPFENWVAGERKQIKEGYRTGWIVQTIGVLLWLNKGYLDEYKVAPFLAKCVEGNEHTSEAISKVVRSMRKAFDPRKVNENRFVSRNIIWYSDKTLINRIDKISLQMKARNGDYDRRIEDIIRQSIESIDASRENPFIRITYEDIINDCREMLKKITKDGEPIQIDAMKISRIIHKSDMLKLLYEEVNKERYRMDRAYLMQDLMLSDMSGDSVSDSAFAKSRKVSTATIRRTRKALSEYYAKLR